MARATNKANRSAAAKDPDKRGNTMVSKESMKANVGTHENDLHTSTSEGEDQDLAKVMSGEDIKMASGGGFYTFRSREDCVKGIKVTYMTTVTKDTDKGPIEVEVEKTVKIHARFNGNTFVLTDAIAEGYGVSAKEIAIAMVKNDRRNTEYMLVSGPGVVETEKMIKFNKIAQVSSNRRASQVLQGPRSSGRGGNSE